MYGGLLEWDSIKLMTIVLNALVMLLGPSLLYTVIWYERYSADLMYRTLINQLLSHLCYIQMLNCFVSRLSFILIYWLGPFASGTCDAIFIYAHYAFVCTITEITLRQMIKYLFIFKWKYVSGLNEDFAAILVTLINLLLSGILVFVSYFLGFNNEEVDFHICTGRVTNIAVLIVFK